MFDWIKRLAAVSALALVAACGGGDDDHPPGTLAQVATAGGFTALVAAADKAGLVPALSDTSASLTVFAPTDAAFASLATSLGFASAGAMVTALDGPTLAQILQYHVLPTRKLAADLATGSQDTLYAFEGAAATLSLDTSAGVKITDEVLTAATVTTANVAASNGVIHVIDKVLVPPGVLNVVQMAQLNPDFSTLVGAVVSADLQGALADPAATLTVFAPTNDAFAAIASTVASLTPAQLTTVLTYHVLGSQVLAADIPFGTPVNTQANQSITINAGTPPTITDTTATPASIVATDVRASNGVIHVIGKVLIPTL
jgi:transforming growth factor-beta-induced protein